MTRFSGICLALTFFAVTAAQAEMASGVVYNDENRNRAYDTHELGIEGVPVSNGREIILTDAYGRYKIEAPKYGAIFIIKPSGWMPYNDAFMRPQFFYMHKPEGSPDLDYAGSEPTGALPASIDFPLYKVKEKGRFRALLLGDTQPRDRKEIDYIAHDVVEDLIGTSASFGVVLGDVLFDDLSLYDSICATLATLGIPMYYLPGNHDMNYDSPDDRNATDTYEAKIGPRYYSFDVAQVHFLVLDDVHWKGRVTDPDQWAGGNYIAGLGRDQLAFIERDLALVHPDKLVVPMMHIPFSSPWDEDDKAALLRLLARRDRCVSMAAHTHTMEHDFITAEEGWPGEGEHHQYINPTVCGSWWSGAPDEMGIPNTTQRDGTPNGTTLAFFEGPNYRLDFLPARRPADFQMSIWAPEEVAIAERGATEFFANVFAGSERSTVEFRMNGETQWRPMKQVAIPDPFYEALYEVQGAEEFSYGRRMPQPQKEVPHIWSAVLPKVSMAGVRVIEVRETNLWGRMHQGRRIIRFR